jgi:hypothetical protein
VFALGFDRIPGSLAVALDGGSEYVQIHGALPCGGTRESECGTGSAAKVSQ